MAYNKIVYGNISIHAPTRGATGTDKLCHKISYYFNPRSHEGSDQIPLLKRHLSKDFNPRSHEGSDRSNIIT